MSKDKKQEKKKIEPKSVVMGIISAALILGISMGRDAMKKQKETQETSTEAAVETVETTRYADTENAEFEQYIKDSFEEKMLDNTSEYHQNIRDFSNYDFERPAKAYWLKDGNTGSAEEILAAKKQKHEDNYAALMKFENADLNEEEYFTFLTEKSSIELSLTSDKYAQYAEQFYPGRGLQGNIGTSFAEFDFKCKEDVEDYLTLMETFPELVDYSVKIENWRADQGYALTDEAADKVIEQCKTFLENKDNHYLIQEFDRKIDEVDFLTADEKKAYKEKDKEAIKYLFQGMETIQKTVAANKGKASVQGGIANYKDGKDYYNEYIIPYFTGSDKTGDEIIENLDLRMNQIRNEFSMIASGKPEAYQYFMENAATMFNDFDSKEASEAIDILQKTAMEDYPELPEIKYNASYLSPVLSDIMGNTLAYYMHPAYDDLDNNIIRVNKNHPEQKWLNLAHEGCPGHMFQFNYFMSTNPNLLRQSYYSLGYLEGWAVYSSYNAYDDFDYEGTDDDKTVGRLWYLNTEFNYLVESRLELGVNYEGWDFQQFSDYVTKNSIPLADVETAYKAILSQDPGLILSYSQGYYEMNGMKEYAEKKLGYRFNIVDFNKAVLSAGPCMYKDLKFKIDEYINNYK